MESEVAVEIQPFTPAEFKGREGKFTVEDIPRLLVTVETVSRTLKFELRNKDDFLRLLGAMIIRASPPLRPYAVSIERSTIEKVPVNFKIEASVHPDFFWVSIVTPKPSLIALPGR